MWIAIGSGLLLGVALAAFSDFRVRGSRRRALWRWTGSNRRPSHCERDALPTELHPRRGTRTARLASDFCS